MNYQKMRIIYFSQTFFTDCDFPLISELQKKNVNVRYFFPLYEQNKRQALLDIKCLKPRLGIFRASKYPELNIYKDFIDLDKVFIINIPSEKRYRTIQIFWIFVFFRMLILRADVFHYTWQLSGFENYLYRLPCKKVMTVHDPISHSSVKDDYEEIERKKSFSYANRFVLLSRVLEGQFSAKYSIPIKDIFYTHLGEFSHLRYLSVKNLELPQKYILFFGQILSYKGIEYLCEAMTKIHSKHPDVSLVIAGRGRIYFDFSNYKDIPYIILRNEYIAVSDLATMLRKSLFAVCPYIDATQSGVVQTAFSAMVPVVVTNVGALPEVVKDGIYGKVVPPCDSVSLANAMDELLSKPELLKEYKENIERLWCPTMKWNRIANDYLKVWSK